MIDTQGFHSTRDWALLNSDIIYPFSVKNGCAKEGGTESWLEWFIPCVTMLVISATVDHKVEGWLLVIRTSTSWCTRMRWYPNGFRCNPRINHSNGLRNNRAATKSNEDWTAPPRHSTRVASNINRNRSLWNRYASKMQNRDTSNGLKDKRYPSHRKLPIMEHNGPKYTSGVWAGEVAPGVCAILGLEDRRPSSDGGVQEAVPTLFL